LKEYVVRRTILWNAILLAWCTGAHAADAPDPRPVWEQAVQAKGGRERLRKVQTLAIFMKPAQVVLAGAPANWLYVFPDRYFEWEGRKGVEYSIVVDGTAGRIAMDANGRPRAAWSMTSVERDRLTLNQVMYLLETAWLQPKLLGVRPARLHKYNVLTVSAGGRIFDLSLNGSNLPERIFSRRGENSKIKYDYQMEHYREFQGISLPTRIIGSEGNRASTWDVDYEIDAKYNPKMFERPPDLADGPEPWRRR
jgi:hypothetical protein